MKKKYNTYILGFVVLAVWGIVGYKIFSSPLELSDNSFRVVGNSDVKVLEKTVIENFEIDGKYRDPFLGVAKRKVKKIIKKVEKPKVNFPRIQYTGVISGPKESTFIIKINNSQYFYKVNDSKKGVRLLNANREQIEVEYKDEKKVYFFKK